MQACESIQSGFADTRVSAKITGMKHPLPALLFLAASLLVTATGCSNKTNAAAAPAPPDVEIAEVQQKDVPIYGEWIGTLDGLVNADIKAQVSGYLLEQAYKEGTFVKKGQLLFQIDPRPFQAIVDQTEAQLAQAQGQLEQARAQLPQAEAQVAVAEANQRRTQLDVDRYTPLAQQQAITQQDLDNATQNNLAAKAQVQSATARWLPQRPRSRRPTPRSNRRRQLSRPRRSTWVSPTSRPPLTEFPGSRSCRLAPL